MTTKQTPSSVDLTEAYRKAQVKILSSLHGTNPQTIRINFTKTLQTVVTSLDTANAQAVEESVTVGARQSQRLFVSKLSSIFNGEAVSVKKLQALGMDIKNQSAAADILERKAQHARDTAVYRQNFLELRGKLVGVSQSLQNQVNGALRDLAGKAENTVASAISELRDRLKTQGCLNVQYSNGASVGVDKYATMVCRSARTESANAENLRMAKAFNTDLVECVGNAVTCEVCAQYRGRVFSVSGQDKRYPPLKDGANSPLKNGYDLIHPNCRCEFRAYFEALHSDEENEAKRKFSNRPFEGDKRTAEQARAYQEWQTVQRRAIDEQRRWNELQAVLGKDNPYSNIGALRRALRSDKDSFAYKKSHYAVRDYKQYERWKRILGEENMPKTLAEFQDLKYNNKTRYLTLKGSLPGDSEGSKSARKRQSYTPAKSIAEAERYARRRFAHAVSYAGAKNLDNVNTVNETLTKLTSEYPIAALRRLRTNDSLTDADAQASGGGLEIKTAYLNNPDPPLDWAARVAPYPYYIAKLQAQIDSGLLSETAVQQTWEKIMEMKEELRFGRWTVSSASQDPIAATVSHEYGHVLADQLFGQINGDLFCARYDETASIRQLVLDTFEEARRTDDICNISMYANTDADEFFAECFAAHQEGEKLPDYIENMLKEALKNETV